MFEQFVHTTFDFLLVAIKQEPHTQKFHKQEEFLEELKKKNIAITVSLLWYKHQDADLDAMKGKKSTNMHFYVVWQSIDHEDKIFLGLRAPDEIFEDFQYLIKVSDACSWCKDENSITQANRCVQHTFTHFHFYTTHLFIKLVLVVLGNGFVSFEQTPMIIVKHDIIVTKKLQVKAENVYFLTVNSQ